MSLWVWGVEFIWFFRRGTSNYYYWSVYMKLLRMVQEAVCPCCYFSLAQAHVVDGITPILGTCSFARNPYTPTLCVGQ